MLGDCRGRGHKAVVVSAEVNGASYAFCERCGAATCGWGTPGEAIRALWACRTPHRVHPGTAAKVEKIRRLRMLQRRVHAKEEASRSWEHR